MKSAEEWFGESDTHWGDGRCSMRLSTIKAIQLEAFKAGMMFAAKIAGGRPNTMLMWEVDKFIQSKATTLTQEEMEKV